MSQTRLNAARVGLDCACHNPSLSLSLSLSLSPSLALPSDTPNMSMPHRILGSRMYYSFWESAVDTDEKFMEQMDALCMGECLDLSSSLLPAAPSDSPIP